MLFILEDNEDRTKAFESALGDIPYHIEKTVPEAIEWLSKHGDDVTIFSLDNDLYVENYDGEIGEGLELCEFIIANFKQVPIIVHTSNSNAATMMKMICAEAKWEFIRIVPYNCMDWILETWIETVKRLIL